MPQLLLGDCLQLLPTLPSDSIDSIVTDPPAGIGFMSVTWDSDRGGRDQWIEWMTSIMKECLRILKSGGHALVWALPRTSHWTATAIEDAGFEVRDVVTHIFGSGWPKGEDVSKAIDHHLDATRTEGARLWTGGRRTGGIANSPETNLGTQTLVKYDIPATPEGKKWKGWGTCLKPACEFWILARKPLSEKTIAENVLKWDTGAINIDGCRIGNETITAHGGGANVEGRKYGGGKGIPAIEAGSNLHQGRWPANLLFDEPTAQLLDLQSGISESTGGRTIKRSGGGNVGSGKTSEKLVTNDDPGYGDIGGASRFFYVAKASKSERGEGNDHFTVKPLTLMRYLVRLITPPAGTVLDPFGGSGTTGLACQQEGFDFILMEKDRHNFEIIQKRLSP